MTLSDVDRAELLTRYRAGATTRSLAARFRVSRDTVYRAVPEDERRPPRFQPLRLTLTDQQIIDAHDAGESFTSLGKRLGLTRSGALRRYYAACRRREAAGQ